MTTQMCDIVIKEVGFGEIPTEVVLSSILSRLTMKEAGVTRLVSRGFDRYWRLLYFLRFENPLALQSMIKDACADCTTYESVMKKGRCEFVKWVNSVVDGHIGSVIQEFKVVFFLNNTHKDDINNWVIWALSKYVQQLELDFSIAPTTYGAYGSEEYHYCLEKPLLDYINLIFKVKPFLTSLCLKSVNVSDDFFKILLHTCSSTLENLCLMTSYNLTTIQTTNACAALKHFKVYNCRHLKTIDIQAPKLLSFVYDTNRGDGLELLRIDNASSLSHLFIYYVMEDQFFHILRSLSDYLPHLEYLKLIFCLNSTTNTDPVVDYFPVLGRLKHLELVVHGNGCRTIAGWIPFIASCPLLEKLSLGLYNGLAPLLPKNVERDERLLLCLKTFEINNFNRRNVDFDVAKFVFENALNLQEVIVQTSKTIARINISESFSHLNLNIPEGVKLTVI